MFRFTGNVWFPWRRESRFGASTPRGRKDIFSLIALIVILGAATGAVLTFGGILPQVVSGSPGEAENAKNVWGGPDSRAVDLN